MTFCNDFQTGLISLKDFAKFLNKPESTVRTWRRRGNLPSSIFKKIGADVFIRVERYKKWVEEES